MQSNQRVRHRLRMTRIITNAVVVFSLAIAASDSSARESTVTLNRGACDELVEHVPADDVAFTPGKTVDGRDVASADLDDGQGQQLPETIPILITTELRDFYHVPFSSPLFDADGLIGLVSYDRVRRRFTFNGVELGDPEQRLLAAQCRAAMAQTSAP